MNKISSRTSHLLASSTVRRKEEMEEAGNGVEDSQFGGAEGAAEAATAAAWVEAEG